jgi:hypothetical protein
MKNWEIWKKLTVGAVALLAIVVLIGLFLARNSNLLRKAEPDMGSFGNAGKRTKRVFKTFVPVNLSANEHLHYFIIAKGASPSFSLSCQHKTLWSEQTFGPPAMNYERVWPANPGEADAVRDEYVFLLSFTAATNYTLRIERHDAVHRTLEVMEDIDYESTDHSDVFREFFTVKTQ